MRHQYSRRRFIQGAAALAAGITMPQWSLANESIKLGSLLDLSGPFDAYGKPMDKAVDLAVSEINAAGGLVGRKLQKVAFDTQSTIDLYTQYVREMTSGEKVDVVHGGILSASREAIRPTLRKRNVLYFYNVLYEGGVCDRNIVCTGTTPAQQVEAIIPEAINRWGKKVYVLAADYNYGQITAKWVKHYTRESGARLVRTDFFPLDINNFNATITRIQDTAPDLVVSVLVGGAHLSFYRQWAAAGMNSKIPMASTTLGAGNEHLVLTPKEGNGILVAFNYAKSNSNWANKKFLKAWKSAYGNTDDIHEIAVSHYQGIHLWAEAVRRVGSIEHDAIINEIEKGGLSIHGPSGLVTLDPQTHHAVLDIHLMTVKDQQMNIEKTIPQKQPQDTQSVCNLLKNPGDNQQYEIKV